jgi:hypothetical protein
MLATDGPYILECAVKEERELEPMVTPKRRRQMKLHRTFKVMEQKFYTLLVYMNLAVSQSGDRRCSRVGSKYRESQRVGINHQEHTQVHHHLWSDEDQIQKSPSR